MCATHQATLGRTRATYKPHKSRFLSAALCAPHTPGGIGAKTTTSAKPPKKRLFFPCTPSPTRNSFPPIAVQGMERGEKQHFWFEGVPPPSPHRKICFPIKLRMVWAEETNLFSLCVGRRPRHWGSTSPIRPSPSPFGRMLDHAVGAQLTLESFWPLRVLQAALESKLRLITSTHIVPRPSVPDSLEKRGMLLMRGPEHIARPIN